MELALKDVSKHFGTKTAVDRFTVTLNNGVCGLLGANGAGKTTLMRMICDIQMPSGGSIQYGKKDIRRLDEQYRAVIGYLPQGFSCSPNFSASEFLHYMSALKGLAARGTEARISQSLEAVDLAEVRNKKIRSFSGGMKQRLGIAQALLNDPHILVLDEPTAGLDPKERVRFRNLISSISKNKIVLLSTHIVSDIEYIADEILVMKAGKLLHSGRPANITAEITGCVWECRIPSSQVDKFSEQYTVGNLRNAENGQTVLRIVSDQRPTPSAQRVQPALEDLYLYYFKEASTDE